MAFACLFTAAVCFGEIYKAGEYISYDRTVTAFDIPDKDIFSVFGKEYRVPVISVFEKTASLFKNYSPGIIKLLHIVFDGIKEFSAYLIKGGGF